MYKQFLDKGGRSLQRDKVNIQINDSQPKYICYMYLFVSSFYTDWTLNMILTVRENISTFYKIIVVNCKCQNFFFFFYISRIVKHFNLSWSKTFWWKWSDKWSKMSCNHSFLNCPSCLPIHHLQTKIKCTCFW